MKMNRREFVKLGAVLSAGASRASVTPVAFSGTKELKQLQGKVNFIRDGSFLSAMEYGAETNAFLEGSVDKTFSKNEIASVKRFCSRSAIPSCSSARFDLAFVFFCPSGVDEIDASPGFGCSVNNEDAVFEFPEGFSTASHVNNMLEMINTSARIAYRPVLNLGFLGSSFIFIISVS